jgi:hypothetical protein
VTKHNAPNHAKYQDAVDNYDAATYLLTRSEVDENGCRIWRRATMKGKGYGVCTLRRGSMLLAHRLSYWVFRGPVTGDLVVDHMCQVRSCIEPTHLRLLTAAENMSVASSAHKSHCAHGHEMTESNTYVFYDRKDNPHRQCRACRPAIDRRSRARRAGIGNDELRQAALAAG